MTRLENILKGVDAWAGFYRWNPHRFVKDYIAVDLRLFQKILICMMNISVNFVYIASRGQGKSFLTAIFCCVRAILYPGSKIVIASGTRGQAINVLEKIMLELKPNSPLLANEIDEKGSKMNGTNAIITFKNTSFIKVVTSGESSRGNRAHVLIIDEFRLVSKDTIDTILRKFLSNEREPLYSELTKAQKMEEKKKERNKILSLSSAYFQDHWSYTKCTDTCRFMLDDKHTDFICGLPWQLAVSESLLSFDDVLDQMAESDFTEVKWSMEMGALWWGAGVDSFFDYGSISKNRHIKYPMYPEKLSTKLNNSALIKIPPKQNGEIRLISADIALMSSKKHNNDATAIFVTQLLPTKSGKYSFNVVYTEQCEGMRTDEQALVLRKLYDEFGCDYIVLDANGKPIAHLYGDV